MTDQTAVIARDGLAALMAGLRADGFRLLGPTRRDDAIVYDDIETPDDLPEGWTDEQDGGRYRLHSGGMTQPCSAMPSGRIPGSSFLHPPLLRLWRAERDGDGRASHNRAGPAERFAFIGVRACELHAIAIQDACFCEARTSTAPTRRAGTGVFIVAVNCGEAGGTCFCVSMNTGPKVEAGFDLALTELLDGEAHEFLVEIGSERGAAVLAESAAAAAAAAERSMRPSRRRAHRGQMGRHLDTDGLQELLQANPSTQAGTTSRRAA